jgi:hypothetical protein
LAIRQRLLKLSPATITHVAGTENTLANIASLAISQIGDDNHLFDTLFSL